jgi:hypothetical protein
MTPRDVRFDECPVFLWEVSGRNRKLRWIEKLHFAVRYVTMGIREPIFRKVRKIFKKLILHFKVYIKYVGFEVLTAVVMKSTVFWDITPCILLSVNRRLGRDISPPSSGSKK